jgi:Ca-activated chloride channel family protein
MLAALPVLAENTLSPQCQKIRDDILADHPTDFEQCGAEVAAYELDQCTPPETFGGEVPTSHMILAMDASGSMAGQVGGETKMVIAQREALAFLTEIPREVKVGLAVYGHRGNNQLDGKVESCEATELIHDFSANRRQLKDSISALRPTGWTALGGVLNFAGEVVAELDPPREGELAPVIYILSDGEETCDGDPVAAAAALYEAGVQTTVNTIGFDVDADTAAQLEAIADAAGGTYYPADTAQSLRDQLNAIRDSEISLNNYNLCVNRNMGRIAMVYHNARVELVGCFGRNNPAKARGALLNAMNKSERENAPEAACAAEIRDFALNRMDSGADWLSSRADPLTQDPLRLIEDYRSSVWKSQAD